jgi:hypothetical protein
MVVAENRTRVELRKKPRRQFHHTARIVTDPKTPQIACCIDDISESGAHLTLKSESELPDTFVLLLTVNGEARRNCRVVWRDGLNVGVEFPRPR